MALTRTVTNVGITKVFRGKRECFAWIESDGVRGPVGERRPRSGDTFIIQPQQGADSYHRGFGWS
jgi:hypothetical protein